MNDFLSDNSSGLCPQALEAVTAVRGGRAVAYGDDDDTARAVAALRQLLGDETEAFFVATGTAANTLALASLARPWGRILCEEYAHVANDESTAPELLTGCRVVTIPAAGRKLTPEDIERRDAALPRGIHHPEPAVVTLTNPTEFGEVYTPEELRAVTDTSHRLGYRVHVDGARFANAVAALDCDPRALTVDAGIDALTFGGTKNGLAMGEAVVFLPGPAQADAVARFPHLRKASGHLLSKHRYVTAPFAAVLAGGAWLTHARHANAMARRLSLALTEVDLPPRFPTDANGVFVVLPDRVRGALRDHGWAFHTLTHPDGPVSRFMMSFDTDPDRVDLLASHVRTAQRDA